jgi:hypothetical protein
MSLAMATEVAGGTAAGGLIGEELEPASRSAPGSPQARPQRRWRRLIRLHPLSFMAIPPHTLIRYMAILPHTLTRYMAIRDDCGLKPFVQAEPHNC